MRKRECCIGCEAILSRLTYSEEELELQKKSTALVLVDVFTSAILGKKKTPTTKKSMKFLFRKLEKTHPFLTKSSSIEIFTSCYLIIKSMFKMLIEFNVIAVFKIVGVMLSSLFMGINYNHGLS